MNEKLAGEKEGCQEGNLESVVGACEGTLWVGNTDVAEERREAEDLAGSVEQDEGGEADTEAADDGFPQGGAGREDAHDWVRGESRPEKKVRSP